MTERQALHAARRIASELQTNVGLLRDDMQSSRVVADALRDVGAGVELLSRVLSEVRVTGDDPRREARPSLLLASTLVQRIAASVSRSSVRRGVTIAIETSQSADVACVNVAASALVRSFGGLVDSIVRGSPRGATIHLTSRMEDGRVLIEIEGPTFDDGPLTIPRRRSGVRSALDLTLCRAAVEAHDGTVFAEHSGLTAHVRVTLPNVAV